MNSAICLGYSDFVNRVGGIMQEMGRHPFHFLVPVVLPPSVKESNQGALVVIVQSQSIMGIRPDPEPLAIFVDSVGTLLQKSPLSCAEPFEPKTIPSLDKAPMSPRETEAFRELYYVRLTHQNGPLFHPFGACGASVVHDIRVLFQNLTSAQQRLQYQSIVPEFFAPASPG